MLIIGCDFHTRYQQIVSSFSLSHATRPMPPNRVPFCLIFTFLVSRVSSFRSLVSSFEISTSCLPSNPHNCRSTLTALSAPLSHGSRNTVRGSRKASPVCFFPSPAQQ
jgi:hypothetical protein